jgi:hypothetical protein
VNLFIDVNISRTVELKRRLHQSRNHLKNNYKLHLDDSSEVADHYLKYGLSDRRDSGWQEHCSHAHNMECDQCMMLKSTLNDLQKTIESCNMTEPIKLRYLHRFDQNTQLIWDWKAHLMRCVQQDRARVAVLENLQNDSVLVLIDWAMKWLPLKYREAQREFFGKLIDFP